MQNSVPYRQKTQESGESKSFIAKLDPELERKVNMILNRMPSHIKAAVTQKNAEDPKNSLREILQTGPFARNSPMKFDNVVKHSDLLFHPYFQQEEPHKQEEPAQFFVENRPEQVSSYDYKSSIPLVIEKRPTSGTSQPDENLASLRAHQEILDRKVDDALRRSQLITKSPRSLPLRSPNQLLSPTDFQSPGRSFRSANNKLDDNVRRSEVKYRGSEQPSQSYRNPHGFLSPQSNSVQQHYRSNLESDNRYRLGPLNGISKDSPVNIKINSAFREGLKRSQAIGNGSDFGAKEKTFVSGFLEDNTKNDLFSSIVQEKFVGSNGSLNKSPRGLQFSGFLEQKPNFVDEKYKDGSSYLGELLGGIRSGRGTFTSTDGSKYEGEWEDGEKSGYGTQSQPNGETLYVGEWHRGKYHGTGSLFNVAAIKSNEKFDYTNFSNLKNYWEKYEGEFEHSRWNGLGTLFLTNGERFVGKFKNGKVHGSGTFYQLGEKEISGEWKDNRFAGGL